MLIGTTAISVSLVSGLDQELAAEWGTSRVMDCKPSLEVIDGDDKSRQTGRKRVSMSINDTHTSYLNRGYRMCQHCRSPPRSQNSQR